MRPMSARTDPHIDHSLSDAAARPGPLAPPVWTNRACGRAADERGAGCRSLASAMPSYGEWSAGMSFSSGTGAGIVHRIAGVLAPQCVETDVECLSRLRRWGHLPDAFVGRNAVVSFRR